MTNAEMTEILALTDALLEAGWMRGGEEGNWSKEERYPQAHCLVGALRTAHEHVIAGRETKDPLFVWLKQFLPEEARHPGTVPWFPFAYFNDRSRKVTRLRDLIHRAARSLTK